jgi:hypothetical protein
MKQEAYKQLEEHLKDAPQELKDYTLKSWDEQAEECEKMSWTKLEFFLWEGSKEGDDFWSHIFEKQFSEALQLAQENGWIQEHPVTLLPLQVMEVNEGNEYWYKRVVCAKTNKWFFSFCDYESIEEAKADNFSNELYCWEKARPIEEKLTLSIDEAIKMLSELKGIKVEIK